MTNMKFILVKNHKRVGFEWHRNRPESEEMDIYHCPYAYGTWHSILTNKEYFIPHDEKFFREDIEGLKGG